MARPQVLLVPTVPMCRCRKFKGIFVAGAPGYLMTNINPKRGLTNGTHVTFNSLILDPAEDRTRILHLISHGFNEDIVIQ